MKKLLILSFLIGLFAISFTSCKKDEVKPSVIAQMDNTVLKVESIKAGEIEISHYLIANYTYNAALPTIMELKIKSMGTSLLYKGPDNWAMETAKIIETKSGLLNIQFTDNNPNGIGTWNQVYIPEKLINERIVTFAPYPNQEYYICSAESLNGNYRAEKVDNRFVLTRIDGPEVTITLKK